MNEKSIFKKLVCPVCNRWVADETGKVGKDCPKCGSRMFPSIKWHVRITRSGKTSVRSISSRRQEAVDYLHAAKDAARRGQLLPGEEKVISWSEVKREFGKWVESGSLAANTREFYKNCFSHLDRYFSDSLQDITVRKVEDFRDMRLASGAAPKSVAEDVKTLKRIYSLFCRWNSARTAPDLHAVAADLSKVEMPKFNNKRTRFLTEKEVALLLDKCTVPHLKLAIQIALSTGLRLDNIMSLEWKQIDFSQKTITFQPDDMKSKRMHVVPIMGHLAELLITWRKSQRLSPFVFPSSTVRGQHIKKMQTSWGTLTDRMGFSDVCFHTLRHTFASHFLMAGGDLSTLSELLDHASIQITKDRYSHLSADHKQRAIDQFESVFFNR